MARRGGNKRGEPYGRSNLRSELPPLLHSPRSRRESVFWGYGVQPHAEQSNAPLRARLHVFTPGFARRPLPAKRAFNPFDPLRIVRLPRRAVICVKRSIRREVLFALGKGGKNGGKTYRRTPDSYYSC